MPIKTSGMPYGDVPHDIINRCSILIKCQSNMNIDHGHSIPGYAMMLGDGCFS